MKFLKLFFQRTSKIEDPQEILRKRCLNDIDKLYKKELINQIDGSFIALKKLVEYAHIPETYYIVPKYYENKHCYPVLAWLDSDGINEISVAGNKIFCDPPGCLSKLVPQAPKE